MSHEYSHGQILLKKLTEGRVTAEQVAKELHMAPQELTELLKQEEINSSLFVKIMGAIEIVRMKEAREL